MTLISANIRENSQQVSISMFSKHSQRLKSQRVIKHQAALIQSTPFNIVQYLFKGHSALNRLTITEIMHTCTVKRIGFMPSHEFVKKS